MEKIFIVFAKENFEASRKIEHALSSKTSVKLFAIDSSKPLSSYEGEVVKENNCKVILIISDNFLKTESCMTAALPFIQSLEQAKRLLIVSTDGVSTDAFGVTKYTATSFDRVSQVIQYMNFWQEKFLEVRAQSRNNESQLNDKSKAVRNISTEVGEILRLIRPLENFPLNQLENSGYDVLIHRVGGSTEQSGIRNQESTKNQTSHNLTSDNLLSGNGYSNGTHSNGFKQDFIDHVEDSSPSGFISANIFQQKNSFETPLNHNGNGIDSTKEDSFLSSKLPLTLESLIENKNGYEHVVEHIETPIAHLPEVEHFVEHIETPMAHVPEVEHVVEHIETPMAHVPEVEHVVEHIEIPISHVPEVEHVVEHIEIPIAHVPEVEHVVEHIEAPMAHVPEVEHVVEYVGSDTEIENLINSKTVETTNQQVFSEEHFNTNTNAMSVTTSLENKDFKALLEHDSENTDLRFQYANALVVSKSFDEALEQLDIIIGEDRKYVNAYMLSAYIAEQKGDYSLSQSILEKVTLIQPNYPGIYFKLAKLTEDHLPKQIKKAGRYYKEAINIEPENHLAHWHFYKFNRSQETGIGNQESSELISDLNHIITLKPDFADAHFELANHYLKQGDIVNAHAAFNAAAESNPDLKTEANELTFKLPEPIKPKNDNGKIILITGGTSGIGKATAELFAKEGYRVIITGRREERLEQLTKELFEKHDNYNLALQFDVRDNAQVEKQLGELTEDWRNIDILINNAGLSRGLSPIQDGLLSDWDEMIDTNIKGLLYITRCIAPIMVAKNSGHIINVCSIAGKDVYPNGNVYCATKSAVDSLTKGMRVDLFKHNIRVSQIAPGMVEDTEFSLVRFHGDAEKANIYSDIKPLNAGDVAETIYYMATRPAHVNIQDVLIMPTQQAGANFYNRNGR